MTRAMSGKGIIDNLPNATVRCSYYWAVKQLNARTLPYMVSGKILSIIFTADVQQIRLKLEGKQPRTQTHFLIPYAGETARVRG